MNINPPLTRHCDRTDTRLESAGLSLNMTLNEILRTEGILASISFDQKSMIKKLFYQQCMINILFYQQCMINILFYQQCMINILFYQQCMINILFYHKCMINILFHQQCMIKHFISSEMSDNNIPQMIGYTKLIVRKQTKRISAAQIMIY